MAAYPPPACLMVLHTLQQQQETTAGWQSIEGQRAHLLDALAPLGGLRLGLLLGSQLSLLQPLQLLQVHPLACGIPVHRGCPLPGGTHLPPQSHFDGLGVCLNAQCTLTSHVCRDACSTVTCSAGCTGNAVILSSWTLVPAWEHRLYDGLLPSCQLLDGQSHDSAV